MSSLSRLNSILIAFDEGREDRYLSMFPEPERSLAEPTVKEFMENLKKDNRIVWALRWFRLHLYRSLREGQRTAFIYPGSLELKKPEDKDKERYVALFSKYYNDMERDGVEDRFIMDEIKRGDILRFFHPDITHFWAMGIQDLDNYDYGYKTPYEVYTDFKLIERKWIQEQSRYVDHSKDLEEKGKILIEFANKWVWIDLGKASCSREGKAMGHCGNAYSEDSSDRILSLREPVRKGDKTLWKPHCTFIINGEGLLGEQKGFANEKPAKSLHKYIIPLLELDMVKGIGGGGYEPKKNFSVADLSDEDFIRLVTKKIDLADLPALKKRGTPELVKRYVDSLVGLFSKSGFKVENDRVVILEYPNALKAIESMYPERNHYRRRDSEFSKEYMEKILEGDGEWSEGLEFNIDLDHEGFEYVNKIPSQITDILFEYAKKYYEEDFEEESPEDAEDLYRFFHNVDADEVTNALVWSMEDGYRLGYEADLFDQIEKWLRNSDVSIGDSYSTYAEDLGKVDFENLYDSTVEITFGVNDFSSMSSQGVDPKSLLDGEDSYKFTLDPFQHRDNYNFDEEAFLDVYKDRWDENLPKDFDFDPINWSKK